MNLTKTDSGLNKIIYGGIIIFTKNNTNELSLLCDFTQKIERMKHLNCQYVREQILKEETYN